MALLYNEGCPNSEEDFTKCNVIACMIRGGRFKTHHCDLAFVAINVKYPSSDIPNNLAKNIFTYDHYIPRDGKQSIVTFLSNDENEIVFLYEIYPYNDRHLFEPFLCRLRDKNQKLIFCEKINRDYVGRTLSFNSIDIIDKKGRENYRIRLKNLMNTRHVSRILDYNDIFFSRDACHYIKEANVHENICRYSICTKDKNDYTSCVDAKFTGKLFHIQKHSKPYEGKEKFIYLPNICLNQGLKINCTPYLCEYERPLELTPCKKLDISIVKNIIPYSERSIVKQTRTTNLDYDNNLNMSSLVAMTFIPFLIIFFFIGCYIYKTIMKNKSKKIKMRSKEP
ncbi:fam-e protein [Plasmodium gallinaceum]|uniref:Fam-e protein n=1 Tax=Plasmodium gallinaceum TaxID=5849 RepID=A0A1J1GU46_PLAGA|nr:fam-e protein [Plasmodium gallinaceum]CRG96036.1 fam-e protein [Plasmodium gallinaceum]